MIGNTYRITSLPGASKLQSPGSGDSKSHLLTMATWESFRDPQRMEREFGRLPVQVYDPIFDQLVAIAGQVNRARRRRGFAPGTLACLPCKVQPTKVFVEPTASGLRQPTDDQNQEDAGHGRSQNTDANLDDFFESHAVGMRRTDRPSQADNDRSDLDSRPRLRVFATGVSEQ